MPRIDVPRKLMADTYVPIGAVSRSTGVDPDRPITSDDPEVLQAALDALGDAADDDKERAFYRHRLTTKLASTTALEAERSALAAKAAKMSPDQLAGLVPRHT